LQACGQRGKLTKGGRRGRVYHPADRNVHAEADGSPARAARVLFRPAGRNIACAPSRGRARLAAKRAAGGLGRGVRKP
jgi:hypothetical protein